MQAGRSPEWGTVAVPPVVSFVDGGPCNSEALGDPLQRRKHPLAVRPRGGLVEEASHEDVLQAELAREQRPGDVLRAGDTLQGPPSVRGRPAGSDRVTWPSQRRRAGAGAYSAIQWRVYCPHVFHRPRGTGSSPRRPR